jgi:hypothetical protein
MNSAHVVRSQLQHGVKSIDKFATTNRGDTESSCLKLKVQKDTYDYGQLGFRTRAYFWYQR